MENETIKNLITNGSIRNGFPWKPKDQRKTILLLSDDLRMPSGVGTVSKELVLGTCHYFNWVQVGAAISHPEQGKCVDLTEATKNELGVDDPYIRIYPSNGYGDESLIRNLIKIEKPDAILHYTDPRFWVWLYQMEHEIRQNIPIYYYNVWDDLPYPRWNKPYYESSDLIMNISKQTYGIVKNVLNSPNDEEWKLTYIPHGINENNYYPIRIHNKSYTIKEKSKDEDKKDIEIDVIKTDENLLAECKNNIFGNEEIDFIVLYVNRNIRRKLPGDVILAYKNFCDKLDPEKANKCALIMHTQPIDDNGTDLIAVAKELCPYKVVFSANRLEPKDMNVLYNLADVTINLASNEGFGLGTCESIMAGTPIVVNVTGGLQDQCGFIYDGEFLTEKDYLDIQSLHDRDLWMNNPKLSWGAWAFPVWPSNRSLQGSPPTPYIFDDRPSFKEAADKLKEVYDLGMENRKIRGIMGRDFAMSKDIGMSASEMSRRFMNDMTDGFNNWKPRKKFSLFEV